MPHYNLIDLRELRKQRGWTQQVVAERLGLKRQVYNRYELKAHRPKDNLIKEIADLFEVERAEVILYFYL